MNGRSKRVEMNKSGKKLKIKGSDGHRHDHNRCEINVDKIINMKEFSLE